MSENVKVDCIKKHYLTRNAAIDIIRGLAILFVILRHLKIHLPHANSLPPLNNIVFGSGYYGVIMFFCSIRIFDNKLHHEQMG